MKLFKRVAAFALSCSLIFGSVPLDTAFANYQKYITNLTISYVPTTGFEYPISFNWTLPTTWSTLTDTSTEDGDVYHEPEGYRISRANTTAKESTYTVIDEVAQPDANSANIKESLVSGSIYAYRVIPYHRHTRAGASGASTKIDAPYESSVSLETVLFMTDIQVEAAGAGSELTVTWDNPQFQGANLFTGYRLYYQRGGEQVTTFNNYRDVVITDPDLISISDTSRSGVKRLRYTFSDPNIVQGEAYAVKVEPLYKNGEVRSVASGLSYGTVSYNDVNYKISFRDMATKEYRTNDAYISIPLKVYEDGKDFLKLSWPGVSNTLGTIERVEILSGDSEKDISSRIGTIYGSSALYVNTWQVDRPKQTTYYQIRVYVAGSDSYLESEVAYYDPNIVNVTPNKPDIYPKINPSDTSNIIDVYWDTFARYPYNSNEEPFVEADGTYIDRNVNYDLYISDTLENIDDPTLPKSMDFVAGTTLNPTVIEDTNTPVYYRPFSTYYTNENGDYVEKPLKRNKTYYIKVVATKLINGGKDLVSDPAYATIYLSPKGEIAEPQTLSKPPLRIKKKSDGKPEITQNTITVEWSKKWYEVYSEHFDDWYSSVAIRDNNIIVGDQITEDDKVINIFDCQSEEAVRELFKENGLSEERADNALLRYIDISGSDVKYEMQVLDFDLINAGGGYKSYVESIMESDTGNWQTISPTENTNGYFEHTVTGLDKNKTYIIILRPYRVTEDGKKDAYPTYVMGTTLPSDTVVNIMPTVPILREVSHSDSTIEVNWEEHIPNLDYEMVVSEIMLNDPATGGKIIGNDEIVKNGQRKEENLKYIRYYTIRNLFPQTGYYVWVRSIAHNSDGDAYSQWSNPVYVVTDKLQAITPPRGLGLVSQMSLDIYNKSNSLNYIKADYNYLIVEWFKNANDETEGAEAPRQNNQSDAAYDVLSDPEIKNTYIVKFNNLINNTYYYVRAKTKLAVTRGKDGESVHTYAYIVQLSADEDFKDVVEVSVPVTLAGETSTAEKVYIVESEWCDTIRLITSPYDNEYDGNQNPDFYPLPDDDFELIYIYPTLTYRFRSDKEDMEGYDDNLVDQRFITRLVKNRTFNYKLDLTSYDGNLVTERAVEIPYSVISAFDERKISLEVRADNAVFTFKPGFLDTQEVRNIIGYGYGSTVKINILQKPSDIPALSYNQNYESTPQKVSVAIQTKDSTTPIKTLAEDMTVALKLNNRYSIEDNNVGSYEDTDISTGWERIDYTYDANSGYFTSEVKTLGTFAGIAISAPLTDGGGAPDMAVNSVISKMNITDMTKYDPDAKVSSLWFNNLVAAVAMGKKDTTINTPVATDEYNALRKKGMLIDGAVVSREAAVNALIKLYETKTKRPVSYYSDINSTPYSDIKNASKANQTAMLKAAELGFFDGSSSRPKDVMTMRELFEILDIVMTDGNM